MKKYIHIGYPKNFSTSLQRNYFSKHKDIYHLGIGIESNLGYKDNLISSLFEVYLKTAKGYKYQEQSKRLKDHIHYHYQEAIAQNKKCFGASSEHLSFSFTYDSIEFETKMKRIIDLFGHEDLNFLIIARNQIDVIKSLYKESVRVGLPATFNEYIYNLYKFQDRNYLYDFRYDLMYNVLKELVPEENIHFLFFENYRDENKKMIEKNSKTLIIDELSKLLEIDYNDVDFIHFNKALTDHQIINKSKLNKLKPHDLGRGMMFSAEIHRQKNYFVDELKIYETESEVYKDVLIKRKLIEKSSTGNISNAESIYTCDNNISKKIINFYHEGNYKLSHNLGKDIPKNYFNMSFNK